VSTDIGFSHVALPVADLDRSVAFYQRWAGMQVVDLLEDPGTGARAARLSDLTRPFAIALVQARHPVEHPLAGLAHLGVGCPSREEVDRLAARARDEGCLRTGPVDSGYPLGYWAFLVDPDGHQLELSYGQNAGLDEAPTT
jgi:catechol 2,3-dioxygenase-like lactoylglutathione lyase family enzyme